MLFFNNSAESPHCQSEVRWAGIPGCLPHLQYAARLPREEVTGAALELRLHDSFAFCSGLSGWLKRYCIFSLYTWQRQSEWYESHCLREKRAFIFRRCPVDDIFVIMWGLLAVILSVSVYPLSLSFSTTHFFCLTFLKAAEVHWHVNFWLMRHLLEQNLETDLSDGIF